MVDDAPAVEKPVEESPKVEENGKADEKEADKEKSVEEPKEATQNGKSENGDNKEEEKADEKEGRYSIGHWDFVFNMMI